MKNYCADCKRNQAGTCMLDLTKVKPNTPACPEFIGY